ncbi:MAG TPA: CAP domain-containing protein [Candidatus Binatus sp.]|uniref:CAP domain-containing protein n=1 Tax=Candidatus Binatus sp. TaxID=2811406 RepID=UPI002F3EABC5
MLKRPQAARLLAVDRDASGTRLLLLARDEAGVGSAEGSGLRLADASVADRHAVIRYVRGRYYVVDLKSALGTFVNGRKIRRRQELKHGDILRFGGAAPYRFIDPDALKRRRWRRNLRAIAVIAVLVAVGLADHIEKWGLFSATLAEIAALAHPQATSKPVEPPIPVAAKTVAANTVAASASTPLAAPSAPATNLPGPAAYVANVAPTAEPLAASTPKLPVSAPTSHFSASSSMTWLERVNFYRSSLGLDSIRDNPELSAGAAAHARYLLLNFGEALRSAKPMGADAYQEKPGKSGYSASGARAAQNLQLSWGCSSYDVQQQIDRWIEGPFHRLAVFDPALTEAGYGEASSGGCWVAALRLPPTPEEQQTYARAIEFPPDGAAVALDWVGLEAPDPLASCPGYARPVGLPVTLQLGRLVDTKLTAHSLTEDGKPIEHCAFDAPSYQNPNAAAQKYGYWNLRDAGAVVIVPREPLKAGSRYAVSITADSKTYLWNFKVADTQTTFTPIAKFPTSAKTAAPATEPAPTEPALTEPPASAPPATEAAPAASPRPRRTARARNRATPGATAPKFAPERPASTMPPISPMAEETPAAAGLSTNWLATLNLYRTRLNVPPVDEDPALSSGCLAHSKYLITNYEPTLARNVNLGGLLHTEDESKSGYSAEGLKAARASDVMFQGKRSLTSEQRMTRAIQSWIAGPFHRPQLVNPNLKQVGFGEYCGETVCAASLDWKSDLPLSPVGGHAFATPIEVPPDGATVKPGGYKGEWPNPVSSCPGYPADAPAITLQLGMWVPATITDASLTQTSGAAAGTKVGTCPYDSGSYTNPDPGTQAHGREALKSFGQVVMMVRDPLVGGESYRVAMTVNGKQYGWSFTAAP